MSGKISLSGTITVTAASKVLAICKPLIKTLGISFFRYLRIFNDGSKFILCTSADVMKFMYEEGHYIHTWYDNGKPASQFQPGCNFWTIDKLACNEDENLLASEIFKHFSLSDGLFYCYKHPDFVELFDFLSTNHDIYFINKKLLFRFMYYFKEQARKLILQAEHEKIYSSYTESNENNKPGIHSDDAEFIKNTPIINIDHKDYYPELFFNGMNTKGISFSEREMEILHYLPQGKTAKQIALILGISYRTVERHLENIRIKTGVYSKAELIGKLFFDNK